MIHNTGNTFQDAYASTPEGDFCDTTNQVVEW
jgi:hypothetical protein